MPGYRNFCQGGGGGGVQVNWGKKGLTRFFCLFILVLRLFYRNQTVNFKENQHFSRSHRGDPTFPGGGGAIAYSL